MVVLCCYGQGVEEDKEHDQPIEGVGFHVHQALHPEEAIPTTSQTAGETKNNKKMLLLLQLPELEREMFS